MYLWLRTFQLGVKSLLLHPLRSLLTMLGIFIGVASVIWLMAIGEGISEKVQEQIAGLGAKNIIIQSKKPPSEATAGASGDIAWGLTRDDYDRLVETIPTVERALPIREVRRRFTYMGRHVDGRLVGCTPEYAEVTHLEEDRGHFISDPDYQQKLNHCALAAEVAEELFPLEDPIGKAIRVEGYPYVVVGLMKPRMPSAGIGGSLAAQDYSHDVYIPISTLWSRFGDFIITARSGSFEREKVELNQITLRIDHVDNVLETSELVRLTLEKFHRTKDYDITVPLELLRQAETFRVMFVVFLALIAAISLIVGGIGIMNIMLATVTERTREIGIRRALGAKRRDIIRQFLAETISLSFAGGLVGVAAGFACGPVVNGVRLAVRELSPGTLEDLPDWVRTFDPIVQAYSVPLAFLISVGIGIVFGIYPAMRASAMDPIEALRHE
ncbi:MAG: ABC transporter permease [Planctomycetota bacterium]|jgi:putative ABC transport system permease protein